MFFFGNLLKHRVEGNDFYVFVVLLFVCLLFLIVVELLVFQATMRKTPLVSLTRPCFVILCNACLVFLLFHALVLGEWLVGWLGSLVGWLVGWLVG